MSDSAKATRARPCRRSRPGRSRPYVSAVRSIKYDEPNIETYKGVSINWRSASGRSVKEFSTGDFIKDWFDATKFFLTGGLGENYTMSNSSSVDHFIMDGGKDLYDSVWLIITEDNAYFVKEYTEEGIEFFLPKGHDFSWGEYKRLYDEPK